MKQVAIVTLYGEYNYNYGNRLQNYAVHQYLQSLGFECETLAFMRRKSIVQIAKQVIKTVLRWNRIIVGDKRGSSFKKFTISYIPTRYISPRHANRALANDYDYFVVGSDQVWNPCFDGYEKDYDAMFLTFVPSEKKICLSPSFGVSTIPDAWKRKFADGLKTFPRISVREEDGVAIVKELAQKDAVCLIDPTMLLDAADWLKVAADVAAEGYAFAYFLGEYDLGKLPQDKEIYDIMDKPSGHYTQNNPSDFIGYIAHADIIYTDSFHACVFSILFDKPFCVFERVDTYKKMSSRMTTLLGMFGVAYDGAHPQVIHIDRKIRDRVLAEKRAEVKEFLSSQMTVENP